MDFIIGVDSGGTKTDAVVSTSDGRIVGFASAGGGNFLGGSLSDAKEALSSCVFQALQVAGLSACKIEGILVASAAVELSTPSDHVAEYLEGVEIDCHKYIVSDVEAALAAGSGTPYGAVIIAGTGAIAFSRTSEGCEYRVDGWGPLVGDEGGGYWIGLQALQCVFKSLDGRLGATQLVPEVLGYLNVDSPVGLMDWIYNQHPTREEIAAFCPIVARVARDGDEIAQNILCQAASSLSESAMCLLHKVPKTPDRLHLVGGIFRIGFIREAFTETLHCNLPDLSIERIRKPPVLGSVILLLDRIGVAVDADILSNLDASWGQWFFRANTKKEEIGTEYEYEK